MFHRASTVCRPVKPPMLTVCDLVAPGCAPPSLKDASRVPPMKYCHVLVECRAVSTQLNVTEEPTGVAGQVRRSSASTANRSLPPSQLRSPFGPSTLCGSYWIAPQSATL